jgi:NAD-dependent dihydropyrimidine dehydrogenase PreA subunit
MAMTAAIQDKAKQLLENEQVSCVVGYEVGSRGYTRPAFIYQVNDVERLVWSQACTHNLTSYIRHILQGISDDETSTQKVAVVIKPCDSRAINVLLSENQFSREQVHLIGVTCEGIVDGAGYIHVDSDVLQARCQRCSERVPIVYDTLIGEPPQVEAVDVYSDLETIDNLTATERSEFWLSHFDRCIRCYACRQVCPMCHCPVCLYERDDSLWTGMGIRLNEKRTFHLGRAYHLAGRCIGCDECERVCPMNIPISLLNLMLAREMEKAFGFRAGLSATPSPLVTIISEEES